MPKRLWSLNFANLELCQTKSLFYKFGYYLLRVLTGLMIYKVLCLLKGYYAIICKWK